MLDPRYMLSTADPRVLEQTHLQDNHRHPPKSTASMSIVALTKVSLLTCSFFFFLLCLIIVFGLDISKTSWMIWVRVLEDGESLRMQLDVVEIIIETPNLVVKMPSFA